MAQPQKQLQSALIVNRLKLLTESLPADCKIGLSTSFESKIKKIGDYYVPIDPEEVLTDILEKSLGPSSRKNWKLQETSYLIYVIDKYCLSK